MEWNGPWSDSSPEWSDRMRHKLKHVPQVLLKEKNNWDHLQHLLFPSSFVVDVCSIHYLPITFQKEIYLPMQNFLLFALLFVVDSQKMVYSGCPGKTSKFISGRYMFVVSIPRRCVILCMVSGEVTVLVAAKITTHGIKTRSFESGLLGPMRHFQFMFSLP